ncbi:signal transduction histidine kinase/CheY-like chemotaxis protein/HPt (histidine-containing phosphotransfer) domain-containing protein [Actimicrobium sp. GrIS 1.19]|uniref:hybrid sensor histidine kinase/response regulator n=1 Tax=Actimicrobium sp. GrIS 1.19 TaxID=3071708 RepID=UPI002E095DD0|nr:signal transduction histidine kinase/CheY-like chemotaxis protein/HPt (histidine-containing phosphotransfer) domain-containing protein [Actimicrobium sp. GrIS 1.19]
MERTVRFLRRQLMQLQMRHFFMVSGLLFAFVILLVTALLVAHESKQALAADTEHGRLYAAALENHVSEALSAIDSLIDRLPGSADGTGVAQVATLINAAVRDSTRLRSLSVLSPSGVVLLSSNPRLTERKLDLAALGFHAPVGSILEPGAPQFVRDLDLPASRLAGASGPIGAIPFARAITLKGKPAIALLMVSPGALFPEYRDELGTDANYAALFDYRGNVLGATANSQFVVNQRYPVLPMFDWLRHDRDHGQFRAERPASIGSAGFYSINYRATRKYPLVAVIGMSEAQAIEHWGGGSGQLAWLGLLAACIVLLYTAALWWVMRFRENTERELQLAKVVAEDANAARGAFLSTMSHEIRTPMNAVIGMAGLLRETALNGEQTEFTQSIEEAASALMVIIDEILDFSRIDSGNFSIDSIDFPLLAIVEGSVEELSGKARRQGLSLLTHIDPSLPLMVVGDPGRVRQILRNLIGNAIKFTPAGEVTVRVRVIGRQRGNCRIRFDVSDSGIGVAADMIPKLFMPFRQADGSVTRKYGGTGLGLSICRRLVDLMGGAIGIESQLGSGSTFWFELPLRVVSGIPSAPGRLPNPPAPTAPRRGGAAPIDAAREQKENRLVLLVEDNLMNQKVALRQLQILGYAADVVNNGAEALDALSSVPYALVLMDCQMPVLDGYAATRQIRQRELLHGGHVQIVAMTANAMQGDRERCLDAGMDGYLTKPISNKLLAAMLQQRLPRDRDQPAPVAFAPVMLDTVRLTDMFGADRAFQHEMLVLFINSTRPLLGQLERAVIGRNFLETQALAHRLSGSCANLGMDELANLARLTEQAGKTGDYRSAQQLQSMMQPAFDRLCNFVNHSESTA